MDPDPEEKQPAESGDTGDGDERHSSEDDGTKPQTLPDDLPMSLDDRRSVPTFAGETEMYDGWQGM